MTFILRLNYGSFLNHHFVLEVFFKMIDKIPEDLRSSIVYQYKCDSCSASYVGKSIRHKIARVREHRGLSPRTGNPLAKPPYSVISLVAKARFCHFASPHLVEKFHLFCELL